MGDIEVKIVNRVEFAKMPEGTVFAEYAPCFFGELKIKGETINDNHDWFEQQIVDAIDCSDSEDFSDLLFDSEKHGTSIPMDFDCQGRNGLFEPDSRLYAVWEPQDVAALIARLQLCLPAATTGSES